MKKLNLKNLQVQSFITEIESENERTVKGGVSNSTCDFTAGTTRFGIPTANYQCSKLCPGSGDPGCNLKTVDRREC